jgi:protein phosphatase
MITVSAYKSDIGLVKSQEQNEDFVWVDEQVGLFIVADGLGGYEAGEIASRLAATTAGQVIVDQLKAETKPLSSNKIKGLMTAAIEAANEAVYSAAQEAYQKRRMASTIVVALVQLPTVYISHAGDSRAYLIQGSTVTQLTVDDSWKTEFGGVEQSAEGGRTGLDHILTKSIGQESKVEPSFRELTVASGDHLLLCSDGLWDMVTGQEILAEFEKAGDDLNQAVEALVGAANAAGGQDNISIIVIKML